MIYIHLNTLDIFLLRSNCPIIIYLISRQGNNWELEGGNYLKFFSLLIGKTFS